MPLSSIIFPLVTLFVIFKIYLKLTTGWCKSQLCLLGKTAIVTGANTGIGLETALDFAKRGAKVILACRNEKLAEEARLEIIQKTGNRNIFVKIVDFSSFNSVRSFAKDVDENEERLDILVNNAGVAPLSDEKTEDGFYLAMQVNYFSMFLLTNLLLGLMQKTGPARIVNVSSIMAEFAFRFRPSTICQRFGPVESYANTKLCIILFTKELAKRLENTKVTVYSLHPGAVKTEIFRHTVGAIWLFFAPIENWFSKTPEEGAQTTIYCSVATGIEKFTGCHFENCQKISDYCVTKNPDLSRKLWEVTEKLVDLATEEKPKL